MKRTIVLDKFKLLGRDEKNIVRSATPDANNIGSVSITKEQLVARLGQEGRSKVDGNIARSDSYAEIENNIPDLGIAKLIIISNIISPNDMINVNITYELNKVNLPLKVKQNILDAIKKHMTNEYDFENRQYSIVENALFDKGAFCQAIIPNEEYMKNTGRSIFTSSSGKLESDLVTDMNKQYNLGGITLTTDLSSIKLRTKDKSSDIRRTFKTESDKSNSDKLIDKVVDALLSNDSAVRKEDFISISSVEATKGRPVVLDVPFESVIPIIDTSAPDVHYGYFILLDEQGSPINKYSYSDIYSTDVRSRSLSSGVVELNARNANNVMVGDGRGIDTQSHTPLNYELFKSSISSKITNNLKDLIKGEELSSVDLDLMMRTMFYRSMSNMETKVLYLPESMLAYYTFEYGDDGVGKSIYSGISDLLCMKKFLLVISYLSYMERLIPVTKVELNLDGVPADNLETYIEETKNLVLSNKLNPFINLGATPYDMTELIRSSSIMINPTHSELNLPSVSMDTETKDLPEVDEELIKLIDNAIYNKLGILASIVQDGYENEYAILVSGKQKIIGKISNTRTNIHTANMSDHVRKVIYNDGRLNNTIRTIISDNIEEIVLNMYGNKTAAKNFLKGDANRRNEIINAVMRKIILEIKTTLPTPVSETDDQQVERIENYTDALDKIIEVTLSSDAYPEEIFGEKTGKIMENFGNMLKSKLILEKMRTMPYYDQVVKYIDDMISNEKDDEVTKYIMSIKDLIEKRLLGTYAKFEKRSKTSDEFYEKLSGDDDEDEDRDEDEDDSSSDDDTGSDSGDGDDGDDFGVEIDDFDDEDADADEGEGDEEPEEDEPEEDEDEDDDKDKDEE